MEVNELKAQLKPQLSRLKALGEGIKVGRVLGSRVLVKTVKPFTDADRVEKEGLLYVPKAVKDENTPLPTTGVVIAVGDSVRCRNCWQYKSDHFERSNDKYEPLVAEGDMIMFSKFAGMDFMVANEDFRIVSTDEILCTLVDVEEVVAEVAGDAV